MTLDGDGWIEKTSKRGTTAVLKGIQDTSTNRDIVFRAVIKPNYFRILP